MVERNGWGGRGREDFYASNGLEDAAAGMRAESGRKGEGLIMRRHQFFLTSFKWDLMVSDIGYLSNSRKIGALFCTAAHLTQTILYIQSYMNT